SRRSGLLRVQRDPREPEARGRVQRAPDAEHERAHPVEGLARDAELHEQRGRAEGEATEDRAKVLVAEEDRGDPEDRDRARDREPLVDRGREEDRPLTERLHQELGSEAERAGARGDPEQRQEREEADAREERAGDLSTSAFDGSALLLDAAGNGDRKADE